MGRFSFTSGRNLEGKSEKGQFSSNAFLLLLMFHMDVCLGSFWCVSTERGFAFSRGRGKARAMRESIRVFSGVEKFIIHSAPG